MRHTYSDLRPTDNGKRNALWQKTGIVVTTDAQANLITVITFNLNLVYGKFATDFF